jgi:inactivated superfamily I helicase
MPLKFRTTYLNFKRYALMTTLTLGVYAFVPDNYEPRANAASRSSPEAHHVSPKRDPADRSRIAQAKRQIVSGSVKAPASASSEPLLFLSDEYLKREKQTEDRLRRLMTICKGC